jgi:hypothetical protein
VRVGDGVGATVGVGVGVGVGVALGVAVAEGGEDAATRAVGGAPPPEQALTAASRSTDPRRVTGGVGTGPGYV